MKRKILLTFTLVFIICLTGYSQTLNQMAQSLLNQACVSYPIKFAVLGDPHPKEAGKTYNDNFVPLLTQIQASNPDLVICCGDLTNDGNAAEYSEFYSVVSSWMSNTSIPFFCLPGNHDFNHGEGSFDQYYSLIGSELNYYIDFGHSRFMLINNAQQPGSGWWNTDFKILPGVISQVQSWMENMPLNGFVFTHIPLYETSWYSCGIFENCDEEGTTGPEPNYDVLHDLNVFYNIRAMVSGHNHHYRYDNYEGLIDFFVSGGAGGQIADIDHDNRNHWLLFTIDETADINVIVKWWGADDVDFNLGCPFVKGINLDLNNKTENGRNIYYASNTIIAGNSFLLTGTSDVKFAAGEKINLIPGFRTEPNSHFKSKIIPDFITCMNTESINVSPQILKSATEMFDIINEDSDISGQPVLNVLPNPNSGLFTIQIIGDINDINSISVFSLTGKMIYNIIQPIEPIFDIDIRDKDKGFYIIKSDTKKGIIIDKIIKL